MNYALSLVCPVDDAGKLRMGEGDRAQINALAHQFAGKALFIQMHPVTRRSQKQRAYYWAVVVTWIHARLTDAGYILSRDDVNELLKLRLNASEVFNPDTGEFLEKVPQSFESLGVERFGEKLDQIAAWCMEMFGEAPPPPDPSLTFREAIQGAT
jgi:hypothetical protein